MLSIFDQSEIRIRSLRLLVLDITISNDLMPNAKSFPLYFFSCDYFGNRIFYQFNFINLNHSIRMGFRKFLWDWDVICWIIFLFSIKTRLIRLFYSSNNNVLTNSKLPSHGIMLCVWFSPIKMSSKANEILSGFQVYVFVFSIITLLSINCVL